MRRYLQFLTMSSRHHKDAMRHVRSYSRNGMSPHYTCEAKRDLIDTLNDKRGTLNDLWLTLGTRPKAPEGSEGGLDKPEGFAPQGRAVNGVAASQPLQWSSEYAGTDLGLVYYNYPTTTRLTAGGAGEI